MFPCRVTDVWVAGRRLLRNRELTSINEEELLVKAKSWGEKLSKYRTEAAAKAALV
jgi:hypothetical protein